MLFQKPGAREALKLLIRSEVEQKRPGLDFQFMSDVMGAPPAKPDPTEGVREIAFTIVTREPFEDTRYVFQQFSIDAVGSRVLLVGEFIERARVEVTPGVEDWLRLYDREVAEGPFPVESE